MQINLTKIKIREIGSNDINLLTTYRIAYLTEIQGEKSEEYQQQLKNELNRYFTEALAENSFFAFLAELNGEIISLGAMVIKKIPGDFDQLSYLEGDILNMYTIPFARRKGVSAMILEQLLAEARNRGISKVSLRTSEEGEKLYRKFGFSEPFYPVLEMYL
jgi:GNAT superfamily N-acetyltransferase